MLLILYDILKCPFIIYEKNFGHNIPSESMRDLCGVYNSSLLYLMFDDNICKPKSYDEVFGLNENKNKLKAENENKTPLESLFIGNAKYPFYYEEFNILLFLLYKKNYAEKYNKTLSKDDFETEEEFQKKGKKKC